VPDTRNGTSPERPAAERAEDILDDLGERLGRWFARVRPRLEVMVALAREEAEDIWAEAQHVRTERRAEAAAARDGKSTKTRGSRSRSAKRTRSRKAAAHAAESTTGAAEGNS
jgi:hypothetical protein